MRSTLDRLISIGGLLLAVVLLVAGGLLLWANIFITNQVHDQLAAQKITMPTEETGLADLPAEDKAALEPYAGQQMTTGNQARAYADHYIAVHLSEVAGGKTYSQVSAAWLADPSNQKLAQQRQTLFMGETLRGLLLNAWGWGTIGTIATIAGIVLIGIGGILLVIPILAAVAARRRTEARPARAPEPTAAA
jgi:hypothetical protein